MAISFMMLSGLPENNHHQYLDEDGLISVIVDFDHTPRKKIKRC